MAAASEQEIKAFVDGMSRRTLVVIGNEMGGTQCRIMGRVTLSLVAGENLMVKFHWVETKDDCDPREMLTEYSFYIGSCPKDQRVQFAFLRAKGGQSYNLCPAFCHSHRHCGEPSIRQATAS